MVGALIQVALPALVGLALFVLIGWAARKAGRRARRRHREQDFRADASTGLATGGPRRAKGVVRMFDGPGLKARRWRYPSIRTIGQMSPSSRDWELAYRRIEYLASDHLIRESGCTPPQRDHGNRRT